jgi:hypothetical protein
MKPFDSCSHYSTVSSCTMAGWRGDGCAVVIWVVGGGSVVRWWWFGGGAVVVVRWW